MKNNFLKKYLVLVLASVFVAIPAFAENWTYTVLAPMGEIQGAVTLQSYLPALFNLVIGISATFAVIMIVFGGLQYMTTDALQGKAAGKERIKNALFGLILVLCAWLILATINPDLLSFNLSV